MDKGGKRNEPNDKKVDDDDAPGDNINYMRQEKKEDEDSPALKITWLPQHEDMRATLKRAKKD